MTREITLRDFHGGDEGPVFAVVRSVLEEHGLPCEPEDKDGDLADIAGSYVERGGAFKVVEFDGLIVGACGLYPLEGTTVELRKMYLLPELRGLGIGRALLEDALGTARELGFEEVVLETHSVLQKAIDLYREYGFVECGLGYSSDRVDGAMRLRLQSSGGS
jgi:putative acetyltransferase